MRDRTARRPRLERDASQPVDAGYEDRRRVQDRRARDAVARRPDVHARCEVARNRGPSDQRAGAEQDDLPAGEVAYRAQHAARDDPLVGAQLDDDRLASSRRGRRASCRRRERRGGSRPGTAPRRPRERSRSARAARRAGRAASPAASGRAGSRDGSARRTSRPRARRRRGARGTRATASRARNRARRRTRPVRGRATGWRGRRPARPSASGARSGSPAPTAITSACSRFASARRPASRSPPRVDGASTVTSWPRLRRAPATPATCSLTSCGCDQANGVTKQILIAQG